MLRRTALRTSIRIRAAQYRAVAAIAPTKVVRLRICARELNPKMFAAREDAKRMRPNGNGGCVKL